MNMVKTAPMLILAAGVLSGCVEASTMNPRFGEAYRQHLVSQVADPDANYSGVPAPGSNGSRVGLAQERYRTGKVIKPVPATASQIGATMGAGTPPQQ